MIKIVFAVFLTSLLNICWSGAIDTRALKMPFNCKTQTYCTEAGDYYPYNKVKTALSKNSELRKWGKVEDWCAARKEDPARTECGVGECGLRVYYVKDANNKPRVVLQSVEEGLEFKQLYDITKCEHEGVVAKTRNLNEQALKNHTLTCNTTYSDYSFHVLKSNGDGVEYIRAKLPVCCLCKLKINK